MMKYFRSYAWWVQLSLLCLIVISVLLLGSVCLTVLVPKFTGISLEQLDKINEHSPFSYIRVAVIAQGVLNMSFFLLPAILFAYLAHPDPAKYIGLKAPGKFIQPVLAVVMMLAAIPLLEGIEWLISNINFGADVKAKQAEGESMMRAFMNMPSLPAFIRTFVVMAIIPGLGEELFFRGLLMRFTAKFTKSAWISIVFTSLIFALSHSNIYGLASIFLAGCLLALTYYLTGSIWCGVLAHISFNGSQVVLSYLATGNEKIRNFESRESLPPWLFICSVVVFCISLLLLIKYKTPLPNNWTADFEAKPPINQDEGSSEIFN